MKEINLINDLINRVVDLTTVCLDLADEGQYEELNSVMDRRGKILDIISVVREKINTNSLPGDEFISQFNNQVSLLINEIIRMDDYIVSCLKDEKEKTQIQIAKTFKNKENLKGYNLNNLK
jgi:hypothetical protein